MLESEFDAFSGVLSAFSELYGKRPSPTAIGLWWAAMREYDLLAVQEAFDRHIRNPDSGKWMPTPADLIKMVAGSTQDAALLAWAKVDRAVRTVGQYRSVVFDDPLIHACISEMGGWVELSRVDDKEWPFRAKEFENRYRSYRGRSQIPRYVAHLVGIAEANNARAGMPIEIPVLIGDELRCIAVMRNGVDSPIISIRQAGYLLSAAALKALQAPNPPRLT